MHSFYALLNDDIIPRLMSFEVSSSLQIPQFILVGLPGQEVHEARERVRSAIEASGFEFPRRRVVLNLSPAGIPKEGSQLDLAMALAVLHTFEQKAPSGAPTRKIAAWGELSLDGTIRPGHQLTRLLYAVWKEGVDQLVLASGQQTEITIAYRELKKLGVFMEISPPKVAFAADLRQAWTLLKQEAPWIELPRLETPSVQIPHLGSFTGTHHDDLLCLPPHLERMLGVAASGFHHLLLVGPQGSGKSYALKWLEALMPQAASDVLVLQTLMQEASNRDIALQNKNEAKSPVRRVSPHINATALCGSFAGKAGFRLKPGEFSLAHGGALIADEFPEWPRDAREALREPLETGFVTLHRSTGIAKLPARFLFAGTGNLCPCGGWPMEFPLPEGWSPETKIKKCACNTSARQNYIKRLSGPVLDRIDLVLRILPKETRQATPAQTLERLRDRVTRARNLATEVLGSPAGLTPAATIEALVPTVQEFGSLRNRHKLARIAYSLGFWDGLRAPNPEHWVEARFCRTLQMC